MTEASEHVQLPGEASWREMAWCALLFGSMGAITWAIRGTDGWDGIEGTIVPGMLWGVLWYYVCWRRGIDARGVALWLGAGIAIGGELGYGQYVSWIQGRFHVGNEITPVFRGYGHLWFALCGIGWAAPGGAALGWVLSERKSFAVWLGRLWIPAGMAWLGWRLVLWCPGLFFPNYGLGIYEANLDMDLAQTVWINSRNLILIACGMSVILCAACWPARGPRARWIVPTLAPLGLVGMYYLLFRVTPNPLFAEHVPGMLGVEPDKHLSRTVYTNTQNFVVVAWWAGVLLTAALQRDRRTLVVAALLGGGFAVGFWQSAMWCYGYSFLPGYIDWWKVWELNAGFNLGLLYVAALYWSLKHLPPCTDPGGIGMRRRSHVASHGETLRGLMVILAAFVLVYVTWRGATSRLVVVLEWSKATEVDQYAWPLARNLVFWPGAALLILGAAWHVRRVFRAEGKPLSPIHLEDRMVDLFTFLALVGALTIWPSKISILYAFFFCLALASWNRLNRELAILEEVQSG